MPRMTALEEYIFSHKQVKRIVRHYRRFDGKIACGSTSTRIEATGVKAGVTCLRCKAILACGKGG